MRPGLITLIPKPGNGPRLLDNLQPITFLNNDYKITGDTQTGFIRVWSIHNNIQLDLVLLEYNKGPHI